MVYAAVGDSTGAGFGARSGGYVERLFAKIDRERPGSRLLNLSAAGAGTEQVLRRQVGRALAARPTLVTISVGTNDLLRGVPEEQFAENYEGVVARLGEAGAVVVATTLPDLSSLPETSACAQCGLPARLAGFNRRIETIARRHRILLVDIYALSREALPAHPEFVADDGMHPSDAGHEFWAEALWLAVGKVID
ncbi:MAG: SGNH/GDSL hydrolase family protein [Acidobacteria bacterium]|nr:SGNH/GDSL hydrolase family protein [Acidobacteriota bacterium]